MFETDFLKIYRNKTWGGGGKRNMMENSVENIGFQGAWLKIKIKGWLQNKGQIVPHHKVPPEPMCISFSTPGLFRSFSVEFTFPKNSTRLPS